MNMSDSKLNAKYVQEQLEIAKNKLLTALGRKELTISDFNKGIMELAYNFAMGGHTEDCITMMLNLKDDYFKKDAIQHFKEDEEYYSKCFIVFEVLCYTGLTPVDALMINQPLKV